MTETNPIETPTPAPKRPRAKKAIPVLAALLAAGTIAAAATTSFGQGAGPGSSTTPVPGPGFGRGMGPGFGPGGGGPGFGPGWHHGAGFWRGGSVDPAQVEARIDRRVRIMAVLIGADGQQQDKLATIAKGVVKDMLPVREKMIADHRQMRDLLTAQTIDRAALEKLRADQIATREAASKRVVQALADAAEVLTPDQRTKLNNMLASHERGGFGRWGHPGWGMGRGMMGGWGGWR